MLVSGDCNWKNAIAGQVWMDLEPGRIGFMSTQRRENRWQRISCTQRGSDSGVPGDRSSSQGWKVSGLAIPAPIAQHGRAYAKVGTAPPKTSAWLATNSLQSDHCTIKFAKQNIRRSSPSPGTGCRAACATLANHRSSLPRIASPSGLVRLHPTLSQFPAGKRRWTERYDGKGNLHLLNAA
jgi:hypothetical protein